MRFLGCNDSDARLGLRAAFFARPARAGPAALPVERVQPGAASAALPACLVQLTRSMLSTWLPALCFFITMSMPCASQEHAQRMPVYSCVTSR